MVLLRCLEDGRRHYRALGSARCSCSPAPPAPSGPALLRRLTARGEPVRCLVRDPRRLGPERVRVQIALGDLADPPSFRHALRGVDTVVHLAASIRDQPRGSIEELNGVATWRMVQAAERAGVSRFVFFSAARRLDASARARFLRAKALAERAVVESGLPHIDLRPVARLRAGGPVPAPARAPLAAAAADAHPRPRARAVPADLGRGRRRLRDGGPRRPRGPAGARATSSPAPTRSPTRQIVRLALRSFGRAARDRPRAARRRSGARCGAVEVLAGPAALRDLRTRPSCSTSPLTARQGTADAERLGVTPAPMAAVLGAG